MGKKIFLVPLFVILNWPMLSFANVFRDVDDRRVIDNHSRYARSIGRVEGRSWCTGSLVGKRLVLTAAHCINFDSEGNPTGPLTFYPGIVRNQMPPGTRAINVTRVWQGPGAQEGRDGSNRDWAILLLQEEPTSQDRVPFPVWEIAENDVSTGLRLGGSAGYSTNYDQGRTATVQLLCTAREALNDGSFLHDCSSATGASGGPVLVVSGATVETAVVKIAGIMVWELGTTNGTLTLDRYSRDYANKAVGVSQFRPRLTELKRLYD